MRQVPSALVVISVIAICFAICGSTAFATAELDFGIISPTPGLISYAGGNNPLVGTNMQVDNVSGVPGGALYNLVNASLNFTTGNLTGSNVTTWNFGGGSNTSITIVGGVDVNGDGDANDVGDIPVGTILLTGHFNNATVTATGDIFRIAGADFSDTKDPNLLSLFGLPTDVSYQGNFNISFNAAGTPPAGFSSTVVLSGDLVNTPIPEPGSLLLIGTGLLGLFAASRFRKPRS